jgi:hypothetical protein
MRINSLKIAAAATIAAAAVSLLGTVALAGQGTHYTAVVHADGTATPVPTATQPSSNANDPWD